MDRFSVCLLFGLTLIVCSAVALVQAYNCPYYRPCQQWLKCPAGVVRINGCPTCMCKPTPKPTPRPHLCLTCCGPPPCCNYCGLEKSTPRPHLCLTCCGPPPCCNYCGLEKLLAK
ncbi:keratin-associated protein 4-11-like isoform X2 [Haliotis rubra]|uniref:keratin-associated protein 4-11-like isoform X2 n=1 Tax=Haliotis rubra TaxID=36100 RepID=UPI001EE5C9BA|nr:keratin-associated protein 4-11-like isoform X2 [Haliotis rubra]